MMRSGRGQEIGGMVVDSVGMRARLWGGGAWLRKAGAVDQDLVGRVFMNYVFSNPRISFQ